MVSELPVPVKGNCLASQLTSNPVCEIQVSELNTNTRPVTTCGATFLYDLLILSRCNCEQGFGRKA